MLKGIKYEGKQVKEVSRDYQLETNYVKELCLIEMFWRQG